MAQWHHRYYRFILICGLGLFLVGCANNAGNPISASATPIPPTSTPFPTPLPQFATETSPSVENNPTSQVLPTLPTTTPRQAAIEGRLSAQGATVMLYNGPQGASVGEAEDDTNIIILGRSDNGQWIEVQLLDSTIRWVQAANIDANVSMSNLPITGYVPLETPTPAPDAIVRDNAAGLRLRTQPNTNSNVLANLDAGDLLTVIGRSSNNEWLQVIAPNRQRGWTMAQFLEIYVDVLRLPVTFGVDPTAILEDEALPPSQFASNVISNITSEARTLFDRGLSVGNRPNVFSKVGDSLTVATWAFYPIGWGQYRLGDYGYLQPAIDNFTSETIRDGNNAFSNVSLAADNAWTTNDLLDPSKGDPSVCGINETPLDCEYRVSRPSIALILIGTNDVSEMDRETYRRNLETILDKTIARSILPVLSTLPERKDYDAPMGDMNEIIREVAQDYQIPIWEFHSLLDPLPNNGLDEDGVHLSYPPDSTGQWEATANFIGSNLDYGYNMRNLSAIQVLDALWRQVILGETP